jgi:hypothetical protein
MPKMPRPKEPVLVAISWYSREDYPRVKAIEPDENDMEDTYDEWRAFADIATVEAAKAGRNIEWIEIKSEEFKAWLKATGKPNRPQTRAEYVHDLASAKYATKS